MSKQSSMTVERGLGENLVLRASALFKRHYGVGSFSIQAWYNVKDASWNVGVYMQSSEKKARLAVGKGWDFVQACEMFRGEVIDWFNEELDGDFVNYAGIEDALDERDNVKRNDVGAIEGEEPISGEFSHDQISGLVEHLKSLTKAAEDILSAAQKISDKTQN